MFLRRSDLNTEGTYGCEVSTSTFSTVISERELKVFGKSRNELVGLGLECFGKDGEQTKAIFVSNAE